MMVYEYGLASIILFVGGCVAVYFPPFKLNGIAQVFYEAAIILSMIASLGFIWLHFGGLL